MPSTDHPVIAFVDHAPPPASPPPSLEGLVEPVRIDGRLVGWDLSIGRLLAAVAGADSRANDDDPSDGRGARAVVGRFVTWQRSWTHPYSLGSVGEVEALRDELCTLVAAPTLAALELEGTVLGPGDAVRLAAELAGVVPRLADLPGSGFTLDDARSHRVLLRRSTPGPIVEADGHVLAFEPGRGLVLRTPASAPVTVTGWAIDGPGLRIAAPSGGFDLTGPIAAKVFALAPGAPEVTVTLVDALATAGPVVHALAEAAEAAAEARAELLVRTLGG